MTLVGTRAARKEDPRLLRGLGRFGDDFSASGQCWARVVRSPIAHGRLCAVDTRLAAGAPGVLAVVTAADLPPGLVIPVRLPLHWSLSPGVHTEQLPADILQTSYRE
jgi:carbon-monoxide dehydrogenase large subunit/6-hydroxypseudooxynicotine dehydrogenase subunit gamma